ncbi:MAG: amino acid ABC transporter permease [Propionibacteriaceae bacterium]|jgi:polar amino acid transport system permease protein|nr:amino acid ABC transporter permease [Propionibacteriaceae bacterium]
MTQPNDLSVDLTALTSRSYRVRALPHPWRWVAGVVITVLLVLLGVAFANGQIDWPMVAKFFAAPTILKGIVTTLEISALSMVLGLVLGVVFAMMKQSSNPVSKVVAEGYIWVFRGTPVLLQLLLWFNIALVFPTIGFGGFSARTIDVVTPFVAAVLGLGINEGAYMTEVVRAGLLSVDKGQAEAAATIGLSPFQTFRRITLPQTLRVIIPPIGNSAIGMLKTSSLASTIAASELVNAANQIYFVNGAVIELLIVAGIWYLAFTTVLSVIQYFIERHFGRGYNSSGAIRKGQGATAALEVADGGK